MRTVINTISVSAATGFRMCTCVVGGHPLDLIIDLGAKVSMINQATYRFFFGCCQLETTTTRLSGYAWLQTSEETWPTWNLPEITSEIVHRIQDETKGPSVLYENPNAVTATVVSDDHHTIPSNLCIDDSRFSTLGKLRITSYVDPEISETARMATSSKRFLLNSSANTHTSTGTT